MGNVLDKSKDSGEPVNQDAFIFWRMLKKTYDDPDKLLDRFKTFIVDSQAGRLSEITGGTNDPDIESQSISAEGNSSSPPLSNKNQHNNGMSSNSSNNNNNNNNIILGISENPGKQTSGSPNLVSKISFLQEDDQMNLTMLQTINCKLQLIPPELSHFTLNLDNHTFSERLFLSICSTILNNNQNYHNRHLASTIKDSPITTVKKKKIHAELDRFIQQYYFNLSKLSLKKTMLTLRSVEALSQALASNRSIVELDLGGNDLESRGISLLLTGLKENRSITRLNLSDVKAYDEGAFMIAAYLFTSKSVRTIDLSSNQISEKGFEALKQAASRNTLLSQIYLLDNNIDQSKIHSLQSILLRNSCVQSLLDHIFDQIPWNRKIKNRLQSFKKNVLQTTRSSSSPNISEEEERTPLFRLMSKSASNQSLNGASLNHSNSTSSNSTAATTESRFKIGKSEMIGKRPTMEDRMVSFSSFNNQLDSELYCVFDGHGGKAASDHAADNINALFSKTLKSSKSPEEAFKSTFHQLSSQLAIWPFIGTTAACVYIDKLKVFVANVGDTRVVLAKRSPKSKTLDDSSSSTQTKEQEEFVFEAIRLTFDHRPVEETERDRITKAGGTVLNGRVNGMLAVSKALGDSFLSPYVSSEPYQSNFEITEQDKFLIIACDGVWDLISDEEAVQIVSKISDPCKSSETLRDTAYNLGSTDNISVMVVKLNDY